MEQVARGEFEGVFVPKKKKDDEELEDPTVSSDEESDDERDVLDVMKARQYGTRRGERKRSQTAVSGYMLNTSQIALSEDSDA